MREQVEREAAAADAAVGQLTDEGVAPVARPRSR